MIGNVLISSCGPRLIASQHLSGLALETIDAENRKMTRRLTLPKRVSKWTGGEATDPQSTKGWYAKQRKHMRRGCELPYVLPPPRRMVKEDPVAALTNAEGSSAVMTRFMAQAKARVFEGNSDAILAGDDDSGDDDIA